MNMYSELDMIAEGDVLVEYENDNGKGQISFSSIKPYWDYASCEEFEGGFADAIDDNHILTVVLVASEQGGVLVIWNTETKAIEHISQSAFCQAATVYDGNVYTLSVVHQWGMKPYISIEKCKYGTMDVSAECETITKASAEYFLDNNEGEFEDLSLVVDNKGIHVFVKDKEIELQPI